MSLLDTFIGSELVEPPSVSGSPSQPLREIYIAIRVDGADGSGTPDDPYNGATDERLDLFLRDEEKVPLGATIRFGPGIFQTTGTPDASALPNTGWLARSGQKFIGSGMDQTVLQLVKRYPKPGTPDMIGGHPALPSGAAFTPFNNLQRKGTLVQGYNRAAGTKDQELTTEVEDVVLGL